MDWVFKILKSKFYFENDEGKVDFWFVQVMILHCLQYSGGWDWGVFFDVMFQLVCIVRSFGVNLFVKVEQVICFMMGQLFDFDLGIWYVYSNFGYCLLGCVIEVKSGLKYDQYVK